MLAYPPSPLPPDIIPDTYSPPLPLDIRTVTYPLPLVLTCGGHHWIPFQTCSLEDLPAPPPPPVLTSSDGHRAGGTHPTGMLSRYHIKLMFPKI